MHAITVHYRWYSNTTCEVRVPLNYVHAGVRTGMHPTKVHGPNKTVLVGHLEHVLFSLRKRRSQANGVCMVCRILVSVSLQLLALTLVP
jgi:hypothetical protein